MPRFNTTVDDNNPLITYSPLEAWHDGTAATDMYYENYANGSFTMTGLVGATAKFKFYGTGVWIYGGKRPNHGMYTVTLDGQTSDSISGRRSDGIRDIDVLGNEFQAVLFRAFNLTLGNHEVALTNQGPQGAAPEAIWVDVDFITWETEIGGDNATLSTMTLDSSNFQTSGTGWKGAVNSAVGSMKGIYTDVAGDSFEITFEGDAVEVYGSTGQICGLFSVAVDGGVSTIYNASTPYNFTNQLIYFGANLGAGQHTLKMTNSELSNASLVVDHARVQVAEVGTSAAPEATTSSSHGGINVALIGGLCGALGFLIIVLIGLVFWLRKRRRTATVSKKTPSTKIEAFDIDHSSPPQVTMHQTSLVDLRGSSMVSPGARSDVSGSSRRTGSSRESAEYSLTTRRAKSKQAGQSRHVLDDDVTKVGSGSRLVLDAYLGGGKFGGLSQNTSGRIVPNIKPSGKPSGARTSHKRRDRPSRKAGRPLPSTPQTASSSSSRHPGPAGHTHRSTSILKGRRRSIRNPRLARTGYNFLFAQPGSSNSGSAYAPTTVLTSEISERPTTTLSPVTEAPPPLPPSRSQTPEQHRTFQIANRADDVVDIS